MLKLNPTQLSKPYYSNHPFFNQFHSRGEYFLHAIQNNIPLKTIYGDLIISSTSNDNLLNLLKVQDYKSVSKIDIWAVDGKKLKLRDFLKDENFGSSKGKGSGSFSTSLQESIQCIYISSLYNNLNINQLEISDLKNIVESDICFIDNSIDELIKYIKTLDNVWKECFIQSAYKIYDYLELNKYSGLTFHKNSNKVKSIYKQFNNLDIKINRNKWNPSDIWIINKNINIPNFDDISSLNFFLKEQFIERNIIGISLKKTENPQLDVLNLTNNYQEYEIEDISSPLTTKSTYIKLKNKKITLRTFNWSDNFSAEITGKYANHGKIGQKALLEILEINIDDNFKYLLEIKDPNFLKNMFEKWEYINDSISCNLDIFIAWVLESNIDKLVSKYLGLEVAYGIKLNPSKINNIIKYASSELDISSIFLKIW